MNLLMRAQNGEKFMTLADDHMAESNGSKRIFAYPAWYLLLTVPNPNLNGMPNPANASAKQKCHNSRDDRKHGTRQRPDKAKNTNEPDAHANSMHSVKV